ncbi:hypothetical protein BCV72DRAFT_229734 [Rhizopus microsporus var. microsporus]|uniref:Uncharacterized protein n=2 Tax=Rhizopus microsporus TaxID=58291 RepID=A0A2G4SIC9_RHIZD|nr:uncharacterized protein RHIMIDRAFT_268610 [Rhizopus microsporus ATCC 52813]ORE05526.1 hypothetical protein BCV72DRAFT_229734 [Rhizopus microsporus var. microsporus]PHZ08499.1 hypothetical protein RHIMIDRAFT_268610 [Rhizopus microsporus ATCC 52813]
MYESVTTDFPDRKKSGILYLPTTKAIATVNPPILMEIQNLVDAKFISRVIRYCLNIKDKYKICPMVIVIAVNGFETKKYREKRFIRRITIT